MHISAVNFAMGSIMELTADQYKAIEGGQAVAVKLQETDCVVLRKDVYDRISGLLIANHGAADDELIRLGWESGKSIGWDTPEMAQYDHYDDYSK